MYALGPAVDFGDPRGSGGLILLFADPFPLRTSRARRPALPSCNPFGSPAAFSLLFVVRVSNRQRATSVRTVSNQCFIVTDCDKNRHVQHIKTAEQQKTGHGKKTAVASISNFLLIHFARHLVRHSSSIFWCTAQRKSFASHGQLSVGNRLSIYDVRIGSINENHRNIDLGLIGFSADDGCADRTAGACTSPGGRCSNSDVLVFGDGRIV